MRRKRGFDPLKENSPPCAARRRGRESRGGLIARDGFAWMWASGTKSVLDQGPQVARVIGGVGDDMADAPLSPSIRALACGQSPRWACRRDQPHRRGPRASDCRVDLFVRQTAARATDPLSPEPPLAARRIGVGFADRAVRSGRNSKSGSSAKALKRYAPRRRRWPIRRNARNAPPSICRIRAAGRAKARPSAPSHQHRIHKQPIGGAAPPRAPPARPQDAPTRIRAPTARAYASMFLLLKIRHSVFRS